MPGFSSAPKSSVFPVHRMDDLCVVAPAPELKEQLKEQFEHLLEQAPEILAHQLTLRAPEHVGLNDGLIYPGTYYPVGTTAEVARRAALDRAPLRGTVRVIVVLVDFSDRAMAADARDRFQNLFFSTGTLTHGSVTEYFTDVSGGLVNITGEVVGPYRMPRTLAAYAGADNGLQGATPNARTMADDALTAANPHVNLAPYDNDGNGYVDAFIVVHAGRGAEETGSAADIWSHKWVLPSERSVDGTKVFAYLTIPEDAKIGVSAHELGHLVFGWPDLYDTDGSSEGVGNWCLMGGGSWGLGGDRPTHPSAWCKVNQGWANVVVQASNATVTVNDIKAGRTAYRLWKDGAGGNEYFLVENRQQTGYDASLPGGGLLVWHIDEAVSGNTNESHYKVGLLQADGKRDLELNVNRGDAGDPFPGTASNTAFTATSTPNSNSFAGASTCVSITGIPASSAAMTVGFGVRCIVKPKDKDLKDITKERPKELVKERPKDLVKDRPKEGFKELKDKDLKEKDVKEIKEKEFKEFKEIREGKFTDGKNTDKLADRPGLPGGGGGFGAGQGTGGPQAWSGYDQGPGDDVSARLAALEEAVRLLAEALGGAGGAGTGGQDWDTTVTEPFIGSDERPSLGHDSGGPELESLRAAMEAGSTEAKAQFDALPPQ